MSENPDGPSGRLVIRPNSVARTSAGAKTINTLVAEDKALRIQVLDCRSGKPVPNAEVDGLWLDGVSLIGDKPAKGAKAQDTPSLYSTDASGVLRVPISLEKGQKGFSVEVSFKEFAIVPEATQADVDAKKPGVLRREPAESSGGATTAAAPRAGSTKFSVEWGDTKQSTERGSPWGWRLGPKASASLAERKTFAEFKTSVTFTIDGTGAGGDALDWKKLHSEKKTFSVYYESSADAPELVVFALVWCQPVWDEVEDADPRPDRPSITEKSYTSKNGPAHRKLHLVTVGFDIGGSHRYGGKGYGFYEKKSPPKWRSNEGHAGLDIYAREGDNVFAVHGGSAAYIPDAPKSVGGNVVHLSWKGAPGARNEVKYLHNTRFNGKAPTVRAGQIVSFAGRTGNLGEKSMWPTHMHMNVGGGYALYNTPDEDNRVCLPQNEVNPLMFPCHCEVTDPRSDPSTCNFDKTLFTARCWAPVELACPYMPARVTKADIAKSSRARRRVQAQLRYLAENKGGSGYVSPGDPDGELDSAAGRAAILKFKAIHKLTPTSADIDDAFIERLDQEAPLIRPE
jgi:hypothetical protein